MSVEQREGHVWDAVAEPMMMLARRLEERPPVRLLASAIAGILAVGLAGVQGKEAHASYTQLSVETPIECAGACPPEVQIEAGVQRTPEPAVTTTTETPPIPITLPAPTTTTTTLPSSTTTQAQQQLRIAGRGKIEKPTRVYESIEAMQLTREGYVEVLSHIRMDYYEYAQSKEKFNPQIMEQRGIPQHPTQFYTKHVAANYYNADGTVTVEPVGEPSTQKFIDVIAGRAGGVCCGVNRYTNRNGEVFWLAPRQAKLRHNYGYDGITTGDEIEAYLQTDVTTKQLEASAYVDIGNLIVDELISKPLNETIEGHAKTRTEYKAEHPDSTIPAKIDWTEDFTDQYRTKLYDFLAANPDLKALTPASFLALP